jgi:hypothetical protein
MVLYYLTVNVNIFFSLYCIPPLIDTDKALASVKAMSQSVKDSLMSLWDKLKSKPTPSKAESVVMDEPNEAKSLTKSYIYDHTQSVNDVYAIAKFARNILRSKHGHIEPPNTILYVEAAISSLYECDEDYGARDRDNALHPFSDNGIPFLRKFFHEYGSPDIQAEVTECLNRLNAALNYTLRVYPRRILIPKFVVDDNRSVIFSLPKQQLQLFRANWNRHSNPFIENWYKFPRDLSRSNRRSTRSRKPMKSSSSKPSKGIGGKKRKRANHTQRRRR